MLVLCGSGSRGTVSREGSGRVGAARRLPAETGRRTRSPLGFAGGWALGWAGGLRLGAGAGVAGLRGVALAGVGVALPRGRSSPPGGAPRTPATSPARPPPADCPLACRAAPAAPPPSPAGPPGPPGRRGAPAPDGHLVSVAARSIGV